MIAIATKTFTTHNQELAVAVQGYANHDNGTGGDHGSHFVIISIGG